MLLIDCASNAYHVENLLEEENAPEDELFLYPPNVIKVNLLVIISANLYYLNLQLQRQTDISCM